MRKIQSISTWRRLRRLCGVSLCVLGSVLSQGDLTARTFCDGALREIDPYPTEVRDNPKPKRKEYAKLEARFRECERLYEEEKMYEALEAMEALIQDYPKAPAEWLLLRAKVLAGNGEFSDAIKQCNAILRKNPLNWAALTERGIAYSLINRWPMGLKDVERAIELAPDEFGPYYGKARILMRASKRREAEALLRDMEARFGDDPRILSLRAVSRDRLGMAFDAFTDAARAIAVVYHDYLLTLATENMLKAPQEAEAWLKERLLSEEACPSHGLLLSFLYVVERRHDKRLALIMDPSLHGMVHDDPAVFLSCYKELGYDRIGLNMVDSLIQAGDTTKLYMRQRRDFLIHLGRMDEAIEQQREMMEREPDSENHYQLSWMLYCQGNLPEAAHEMELYWETSVRKPLDLCVYGAIKRAMGDEDGAMAAYREAIERSERTGEILGVYYAYRAVGEREKAEEILKACMYLKDVDGNTVLNLDYAYDAACFYAGEGDAERSIRFLADVVARDGKSYGELLYDPDLGCLGEREDFKALLEKCRERAEREEVEPVDWR